MTDQSTQPASDIVLGEDWERPAIEARLRGSHGRVALNRSPLARKIIVFNLLALLVLVAGVLFSNPSRDSLVQQREAALARESQLIADIFEASLPETAPADVLVDGVTDPEEVLIGIGLSEGMEVFVFDAEGSLIASTMETEPAPSRPVVGLEDQPEGSTLITDSLNSLWDGVAMMLGSSEDEAQFQTPSALAGRLVERTTEGVTALESHSAEGGTIFAAASPIEGEGGVVGIVAVTTPAGEIDLLARTEREQVLQMFVVALLVSVGLSLVLASTIANPLSDLAAAAELGRDRNARKMSPQRVRIPDLTGRPDEIGRLSGAMRGMVSALYDRIDANEQFAADVAHEIKNPLASLRSAVGTLRVARTDDQRGRLLDVIDHDVRRLDRLVSDISNASRLDSELVKEDENEFNLVKMIRNLVDYHADESQAKGIEFISDLPNEAIFINGLEGRLAQVFVNLITNAMSFCEEGDAVRVWARRRENRVLVVVEDTGPGIPEVALTKIFNRFYSERPQKQFGNHSGLGLAISKQIVEAHGGVIWAENIRPTEVDITSEPLGARFVVGLPI